MKPLEIWQTLNERQQHYLTAIYRVDQEKESYRKSLGADGNFFDRKPAREWRKIHYYSANPFLSSRSRLQQEIGADHIDEGTGSTFEALAARGLIEVNRATHIWLTKQGRAVARAGLNERPARKPKGAFSFSTWNALKTAYDAGKEGLQQHSSFCLYGKSAWATWVRLRDHKLRLVAERRDGPAGDYRLYITDAGRTFYEANLAVHQQLYPELYEEKPHED
jgi:hypothetical protein